MAAAAKSSISRRSISAASVASLKFVEELRKATADPSTAFDAKNASNSAHDDSAFCDADFRLGSLRNLCASRHTPKLCLPNWRRFWRRSILPQAHAASANPPKALSGSLHGIEREDPVEGNAQNAKRRSWFAPPPIAQPAVCLDSLQVILFCRHDRRDVHRHRHVRCRRRAEPRRGERWHAPPWLGIFRHSNPV